MNTKNDFTYLSEQFADLKILRFQVTDFEQLSLSEKRLIYYLSEATLAGRDIIYDQNNRYNLKIRKVLETIYETFTGNRKDDSFKALEIFLKRVWFSNGIHHHYSMDKFLPDFSKTEFEKLAEQSCWTNFPQGEKYAADVIESIKPILFESETEAKRVSLDSSVDLIQNSANNYYRDVSQEEVEAFYGKLNSTASDEPPSFGLNSRLEKQNNELVEKVWKINALYGDAIAKITFWLKKALTVAEDKQQRESLEHLINYYQEGDLKLFDKHSIAWVKALDGKVDYVNGFIEIYGDALGLKASWEALVNFKDEEATKRTEIISENAQWFEDNSPTDKRYKKEEVKGVSAKVITAAMLGGDCHPATPIGINLPNAEWIREKYGSKSVTIENITHAYHQASLGNGFLEEFAYDATEIKRARDFGYLGGNLHTDLHECLGHGSGKLAPGIGTDALKSYHSTLEETRADLFALYFIMDDKMQELNLFQSKDVAKAEYDSYIRNGLMTQLVRIEAGKAIEESHMRNRQIIAKWAFEQGKSGNIIEKKIRNGKTYFVINDYLKLRDIFGKLLSEVQRIKSEGDYTAGKEMVEKYGVKVDQEIHQEVLERYKKLNLAPYSGFLNPLFSPKWENDQLQDVKISYDESFAEQMLRYSKEYGFLPLEN